MHPLVSFLCIDNAGYHTEDYPKATSKAVKVHAAQARTLNATSSSALAADKLEKTRWILKW